MRISFSNAFLKGMVRCAEKYQAVVMTWLKIATFEPNCMGLTGMVYASETTSRRACCSLLMFGERSHFASKLSSVSSTYSRSGREGKVFNMTSGEVSMSGTAGDWRWNQCWRGRNTCLAISHEMQPGTNWTGPAGSLDRPKPAEQQGGRNWERARHMGGLSGLWGVRSFYLIGCFINVIKHGRALWLCIIADLHSGGKTGGRKKRKRWTELRGGKGDTAEHGGVCWVEREGSQGQEICRIRPDKTTEDRIKQQG